MTNLYFLRKYQTPHWRPLNYGTRKYLNGFYGFTNVTNSRLPSGAQRIALILNTKHSAAAERQRRFVCRYSQETQSLFIGLTMANNKGKPAFNSTNLY
jgi:hypothetical protein